MEVAGPVVGIGGLAALFNNVVDCFEYVQLGREFGQSFQTDLIKLDVVRLRLSRWGEAIGVNNIDDEQSLEQSTLSPDIVSETKKILQQIWDLFKNAEGVSKRLKGRKSGDEEAALNDNSALEVRQAGVHTLMRKLAIKRQGKVGIRTKTKWALYEQEHFRSLISDITDLANGMIELFPATEVRQQQLCEQEVEALRGEDISIVEEAARGEDEMLRSAVAASSSSQPSQSQNYTFSFSSSGSNNFQMGNSGTVGNIQWGGRS